MKEFEDLDDEDLVTIARNASEGDVRGFEVLVRRYRNRVKANCRHITRSADDAEDLAQDVFLKAFFGLRRFEGRSAFRTWLQRIKVHHCLSFLEKTRGKKFVDLDDPAVGADERLQVDPSADRRLASADERSRIVAILDNMSDTLRIPLILRDMDQLTYQEIADMLGIGLSAVKMRIKRAREEFQDRYAKIAGPRTEAEAR